MINKLNVMIIDDHKVFMEGLKLILLNQNLNIHTVCCLNEINQLESEINIKDFHLVFLDISMPNENGIELIRRLKKQNQELKIIMMTMHLELENIQNSIKNGADGYLLKDCDSEELEKAMNAVLDNRKYLESRAANLLINKVHKEDIDITEIDLSLQERKILKLIYDEFTIDEISIKTNLKRSMVAFHRRSLLSKLGAKNTAGLVKVAIKLGLVD